MTNAKHFKMRKPRWEGYSLYMVYKGGMCGSKGMFSAVLVINRASILAILVINRIWFLHSCLELGIFYIIKNWIIG